MNRIAFRNLLLQINMVVILIALAVHTTMPPLQCIAFEVLLPEQTICTARVVEKFRWVLVRPIVLSMMRRLITDNQVAVMTAMLPMIKDVMDVI